MRILTLASTVLAALSVSTARPASSAPYSKLCDDQNGCYIWSIEYLSYLGEEGRECSAIKDRRCHHCQEAQGKKICGPLHADTKIKGVHMATDGAQKGEFRNRFHIRCDVTEPAVSQLPANNDYILDKRMFAGGFEPAEKTMLYNLWWAACRAESEKYKSIAPAPALIQSNQAPAPSPPLKSAQQTQLAQNAVPKAPNQSPSNDKLEKSILLIYQQYLVAKVCEANGGGRINLNQTRERLKLFDKSIRGKGYDPDAMFKKAKEVPLDQAQQIVLTTASMLPLVQGSERAQILLACNQFIQNAEHVVNLTVDALEPKSQSNDKLGDKDF